MYPLVVLNLELEPPRLATQYRPCQENNGRYLLVRTPNTQPNGHTVASLVFLSMGYCSLGVFTAISLNGS